MSSLNIEERNKRLSLIQKEYEKEPNLLKISQNLNMSYNSVRVYAKKLGLKNVSKTNIIWVNETTVECSKCSIYVPYDSLDKIRVGKPNEARISYCRKCRTEQIIKNNKNSLESYLKNRIRAIKTRAKDKSIPFNITVEDLKNIYTNQEGKCFYTDVEMQIPSSTEGICKATLTLSVDKINPKLGYTKGNIVLCTRRANSIKGNCTLEEMKEWLPSWYLKIISLN